MRLPVASSRRRGRDRGAVAAAPLRKFTLPLGGLKMALVTLSVIVIVIVIVIIIVAIACPAHQRIQAPLRIFVQL